MTGVVELVEIEKPVYGGAFLARAQGKVLLTPYCLPGEQVKVRAVDEKRSFALCELEAVVRAAPERIEPRCQHFGVCGGCSYQHASAASQLSMKVAILKETLERALVPIPAEITVLAGEPWGYRNRIRLAVDEDGALGYRARRSRQIVRIRECPIASPRLVDCALAVGQALGGLPNIGVAEVELFADPSEQQVLVSVLARAPKKASQWAASLAGCVAGLGGIEVIRAAKEAGRSPASEQVVGQWGAPSLHYRAAQFDYRVDRGAFFQVNRFLVDELVRYVTLGASGRLAWDLYAGVGLFARPLAANFEQVVAVESAPASAAALVENLAGVRATAIESRTEDFLRRSGLGRGAGEASTPPDLIVVDPPRAGLGAENVDRLIAIGPRSMVYVSCDPATLARDLKMMTAAGYTIQSVAMADMFPQTYHLESVVHLSRDFTSVVAK